MRRENFQEIHRAEALVYEIIPEAVVAAGPNDPVIASFNFIGGKLNSAVHIFEIIFICRRKTFSRSARLHSLVQDRAWFRRLLAASSEGEHKDDDNERTQWLSVFHSGSSLQKQGRAYAKNYLWIIWMGMWTQ
jgi:hypothetical protein